jgi:protein ImuA
MFDAGRALALSELRERIGRLEHRGRRRAVLPFRVGAVDAQLREGGIVLGALHEVMQAGAASEHAAVATLFIAGILARNKGPVLWCLRRRDLFAPALAAVGLHPDRVIYAETHRESQRRSRRGFGTRGLPESSAKWGGLD